MLGRRFSIFSRPEGKRRQPSTGGVLFDNDMLKKPNLLIEENGNLYVGYEEIKPNGRHLFCLVNVTDDLRKASLLKAMEDTKKAVESTDKPT